MTPVSWIRRFGWPPLILGAVLVPVCVRASRQGLLPGALVCLIVAVVIAAALRDRPKMRLIAVPITATVVGVITTRASLGAVLGAAALSGCLLGERSGTNHQRSRPAVAQLATLIGLLVGFGLLLTSERAAVPAAVVAGGAVASMVIAVVALRRPPTRLDLWWDGVVDRNGRRVTTMAAQANEHLRAAVRWLRRPPPDAFPSNRSSLYLGPVVMIVTSAVLVWRGRTGLAVVGLIIGTAAVALAAAVPRVRYRLMRASVAVGEAVGFVISVAVLGPIHLLVLTPLGVVKRVLQRPALDVSLEAGSGSYWMVPTAAPVSPMARMFANQRRWALPSVATTPDTDSRGGPADGRNRRRTVVVTIAAVLVAEALLAGGYLAWQERTSPEPTLVGASDFGSTSAPSLAGLDWVDPAAREIGEASGGLVYTPYTGWSLRDYSGTYVNVQNRVRRSYQPAQAGTEPIDIWFFGGSTMFGFDLQRDLHTIPSEVARLAEADGIPVRVRNYGAPGYVNYQSAVLLSLLLTSGEQPDLVVFYDGINDTALQVLDMVSGLNPPAEPADLYAHVQRQALANTGLVPGMSADPPAPLTETAAEPLSVSSAAEAISEVYHQGVDLSEALSLRYDVPVLHYWQPDAFSKAELDPGEASRMEQLGFDDRSIAGMRRLSEGVRSRLRPEVTDLSGSLDDVQGPVLSDSVHLNEVGGAAVAAAMYRSIKPELTDLAQG